jgi:hypothetical protein
MQHNVPAAIFHLAQYSVCGVGRRCRCGRAATTAISPKHCATLNNHLCASSLNTIFITHGNTVCVRRFGEMFQWRKSLVCCLGALICICSARRRQFYTRRSLFYSRRTPPSFVLVPQLMAAVNFVHFYCVKFCVQMDKKITSNIKFKKYETVNKRSTNSLCAFFNFSNCNY